MNKQHLILPGSAAFVVSRYLSVTPPPHVFPFSLSFLLLSFLLPWLLCHSLLLQLQLLVSFPQSLCQPPFIMSDSLKYKKHQLHSHLSLTETWVERGGDGSGVGLFYCFSYPDTKLQPKCCCSHKSYLTAYTTLYIINQQNKTKQFSIRKTAISSILGCSLPLGLWLSAVTVN